VRIWFLGVDSVGEGICGVVGDLVALLVGGGSDWRVTVGDNALRFSIGNRRGFWLGRRRRLTGWALFCRDIVAIFWRVLSFVCVLILVLRLDLIFVLWLVVFRLVGLCQSRDKLRLQSMLRKIAALEFSLEVDDLQLGPVGHGDP
jgi:hypothetical protein